jgi:hypothetical protein
MNILLTSAYMDFYVNKKKYEAYKTDKGRWNYVYKTIKEHLDSMTGTVVNNITIRDASLTSNKFWGQDNIIIVNDLGYSVGNKVPLNEDKITIRNFSIDITAVFEGELVDKFFSLGINNKYLVKTCNYRIV